MSKEDSIMVAALAIVYFVISALIAWLVWDEAERALIAVTLSAVAMVLLILIRPTSWDIGWTIFLGSVVAVLTITTVTEWDK